MHPNTIDGVRTRHTSVDKACSCSLPHLALDPQNPIHLNICISDSMSAGSSEPFKNYTSCVASFSAPARPTGSSSSLRSLSPKPRCTLADPSTPLLPPSSDEKDELSQAEQAASSSWQKWHDAKQQLSKDASDDDKASVDRLQEEAERKQADLKALQNLC